MKRLFGSAAALVLLSGVSACGLTGPLQRPDPLFGKPSGVDPATLPDAQNKNLPPLPPRPSETQDEEADDELLGGPGGR
ncbi:MAG: lipoprotein [Hyphomonas sp.]|nr:lipoprotein [Hyphomonas sp.]